MTNNPCPVCGKEIKSPVPTLYSDQVACSLKCAELYAEIHNLETKLRRVKTEASDRKAAEELRNKLQQILDLFEQGDPYERVWHGLPEDYQSLRKLKENILELLRDFDWIDNYDL